MRRERAGIQVDEEKASLTMSHVVPDIVQSRYSTFVSACLSAAEARAWSPKAFWWWRPPSLVRRERPERRREATRRGAGKVTRRAMTCVGCALKEMGHWRASVSRACTLCLRSYRIAARYDASSPVGRSDGEDTGRDDDPRADWTARSLTNNQSKRRLLILTRSQTDDDLRPAHARPRASAARHERSRRAKEDKGDVRELRRRRQLVPPRGLRSRGRRARGVLQEGQKKRRRRRKGACTSRATARASSLTAPRTAASPRKGSGSSERHTWSPPVDPNNDAQRQGKTR